MEPGEWGQSEGGWMRGMQGSGWGWRCTGAREGAGGHWAIMGAEGHVGTRVRARWGLWGQSGGRSGVCRGQSGG